MACKRPYCPLQGSPGLWREGPPPRAGPQGLEPSAPQPRLWEMPRAGSASRAGGGGEGGEAVFALGLRASLTLSCLSLRRQVAAPAWASSPTPGHLGLGGPGKGAGGGLCGNRPKLALGTPRLRWLHKSRHERRGLGLAALQPLGPRQHRSPPGSGARFGIDLAPSSPLASIRPRPFLPSSLAGLPSPWGSRSLFLSPGPLTPISSSFSGSVFPSPTSPPPLFPGLSSSLLSACPSPALFFSVTLHTT